MHVSALENGVSQTKAKRLFLLQYGGEFVAKSMSVLGADDIPRWVPVIGIVVETDIGWVVLETGFSRRALTDDAACSAVYGPKLGLDPVSRPWGLEGEPFEEALARIGLNVTDLALAAVSHLHIDHSGGLPLLGSAGVTVVVQKRELEFALNEANIAHAYYTPDYVDRNIGWRVIEGDAEIAPGIWGLLTPGHTPGHMSYRVDLPETGSWIFTIDAADLAQNLFDPVGIGWTALPEDAAHVLPSIEKLIAEARRLDARLVPCHDPIVWKAIGNPVGGHR
jgi:N-acyl homoserine lactone hydrolase